MRAAVWTKGMWKLCTCRVEFGQNSGVYLEINHRDKKSVLLFGDLSIAPNVHFAKLEAGAVIPTGDSRGR